MHFSCQNIWPLKYRGNKDRMRSLEMLGHSKRITRFPLGHSPCSFVNCPSFRRTVHLCIYAQCAFERIWAHCAFIHLCALLFSIICVHYPFLHLTICAHYAFNHFCTPCTCTAQCAFWVVRWPCGQMAIAVKTLSHGKTIVLRLFFLYCFRKKTLKLVLLFIFRH